MHLKAHNADDQLSSNFHKFVAFDIRLDNIADPIVLYIDKCNVFFYNTRGLWL